MTAEQIVDSLHAVVGRAIDSDELTFDPEARMKPTAQNNLGKPRRAWQLTSLSNERDRPALSLPRAAAVAECMEAFGWTGSRQEPINHRQDEPNVIQPGILANGLLSIQLTVMTDRDELTADAIAAAFGVSIGEHPEALAILSERYAAVDTEFTPARRRMARVPDGATLIASDTDLSISIWKKNENNMWVHSATLGDHTQADLWCGARTVMYAADAEYCIGRCRKLLRFELDPDRDLHARRQHGGRFRL